MPSNVSTVITFSAEQKFLRACACAQQQQIRFTFAVAAADVVVFLFVRLLFYICEMMRVLVVFALSVFRQLECLVWFCFVSVFPNLNVSNDIHK